MKHNSKELKQKMNLLQLSDFQISQSYIALDLTSPFYFLATDREVYFCLTGLQESDLAVAIDENTLTHCTQQGYFTVQSMHLSKCHCYMQGKNEPNVYT